MRKPAVWETMSGAQRVRALIDRAGTTQVGAAKLLGVDPRTMRRYCSEGTRVPRIVLLALEGLAAGVVGGDA